MSRISEALFNRNADACESAKRPTCTCHCGGAMHGKRHSETWRQETFELIERSAEQEKRERERAMNPDLFDQLGSAP